MGISTVILMWILCPTFGEPFKACQSPQYLQYGKLGTVLCDLNDTFSAVFWYSSTNILIDEPVVTLTHSIKGGQGYKTGEFDINHDGSLLIPDVDLDHEKNFTVAIFDTLDGDPTIFIVSVVVTGITTDGCDSPQYLAYGRTGVVNCYFETTFESVFWYNSTHVLSDSPIVTYGNSGRGGRGYLSREFDVFSNGSLVINEVGLIHDTNFTVAKFSSLDEEPAYFVVRVIVTVNKLGGGPDIEECDDANATCYIELGRFSTIKCNVQGVRPAVALKWFSVTENEYRNISFDTEFIIDNITFTSVAATSDAFVYSPILSLLACKAEFPPGITQKEDSLVIVGNSEVNLSSIPAVIKHALLGSILELKCSSSNLLFLVWKRSLAFDNQYQNLMSAFLAHNHFKTKRQDNYELERNGSLVLRQIEIEHDGFYCCVYGDGITNGITKYKVVTYVKPVPAYPVVEGCNFQHGCELAVERKGNLTCTMTGIRPEVNLKWKVSDETRSEEIFFNHNLKVMESGETFRITLTSSYSIPTSSQITVECGVSGLVSDIFPEYSVVKLIVISAQVKAADGSNLAVIIVICLMFIGTTLLTCGLVIKRKVEIQKKKQPLGYLTGPDSTFYSPSKSESNASTTDTSIVSSSRREHKSRRELLKRNKELSDFLTMLNAFRYLSSQVGMEWRFIGRQLGLEDSTLDIMSTRHTSPQDRTYLMLIYWKELKGTKASYKNLIKILREAGRKDLADHLQNQQYVSQSTQREWLTVGRMLLLSEEELYKIKNDCTSKQEAIYRMLNKWEIQKGLTATNDVLANSLRGAGRADLAEELVRQGNDKDFEKLKNPDVEVAKEDIDELADMVVKNSDYYELKDTFVRRIIGYERQRGLAIDIEREKADPSTKLVQYIIHGWWKRTHSRKRSDLVAKIRKFNKSLEQEFIIYLNGLDES